MVGVNEKPSEYQYDLVIVGGGVTGTALLFVAARYTNLKRIALVEKHSTIASVNSHANNNSQTLHFGDIETNYTREKAEKVNQSARLTATYLETYAPEAFRKMHKMVLAVGEKEVNELKQRFEEIKEIYPNLTALGREEIARLEPNVVKQRDPKVEIFALASPDGYAVDYQKLAQSFVHKAQDRNPQVDIFRKESVQRISRSKGYWTIVTDKQTMMAKTVVFAAGPHSLIFAKQQGMGKDLGILPVAGNFFQAKSMLIGKVYMMQLKKLPFAAIHGDPEVHQPETMRFGPTVRVLPLLERHRYDTVLDFLKTSVFTLSGVLSLLNIITDRAVFGYVIKNILYDLPWIGKWFFLQDAKKIIPALKYRDLSFAKGYGGIRPQVVNTITKQMEMGEAKIYGDGIIFNITPSPGATVCLKNAFDDVKHLSEEHPDLISFDQDAFSKEFGMTEKG